MVDRRRSVSLALALAALSCTAKPSPLEREDADLAAGLTDTDPGRHELRWRADKDEISSAPVSLTASDGTGLELLAMDVKVVLEDPLAFTEMTLTFHNPEDRVREGRFEINLPPEAAISRFAMRIDDRWQEAEVVERQAARVAYEDFLHRRQDPALLEKDAGNRFRARVFPIPANGTKILKIAYSQELRSARQPYHLPLVGLPRMDELAVDVAVVGRPGSELEHLTIREQEFVPRADLEVRVEREVTERGLRSGSLVVGRIAPVIGFESDRITGLTVLLDTSASRALGFEGQIDRLAELLAALAQDLDFPLEVLCFDQGVESIYRGSARGFGAAARQRILDRQPLGASDLGAALASLAELDLQPRVLIVTDGIITAGDREHADLRAAVARLGDRGVERLDALVDGGIRDELPLRALTTAGLARDGVVASADMTLGSLVDKLSRATHSNIAVSIEGADWVWPRTLDGVQAGDEVVIYAELPDDAPMIVELSDPPGPERDTVRRIGVPTREAHGPLLRRAWTRAKIERMTADLLAMSDPADARARLRQEIIDLSIRERVVSDFTALLVLETDDDYQRFDIDRTALADILAVGPEGIEVLERSSAPTWEDRGDPSVARIFDPDRLAREAGVLGIEQAHEAPTSEQAYGVSGLGLIGVGRGAGGESDGIIGLGSVGLIGSGSGYGRGSGAGFGGRGRRVPQLRMAKPTIRGAVDRDIVRRIVRAHINELRYCYNRTLTSNPNVAGRVTVEFEIGGKGEVLSTAVADNTTNSPELGRCIAKAVTRWRFPSPRDGGNAKVRYPLVLSPGRALSAEQLRASETAMAKPEPQDPWDGQFAEVMGQIAARELELALSTAWRWRASEPGSELALLALGEAAEARDDLELARRAYGSLIDLFPSRADIRRMAGERLERVATREQGEQAAIELAIDSYRVAVEQRPDHPSSHRLLAYALVKAGRHEAAFTAILAGITRRYPANRFKGVEQILREDAGLIAAAWIAARPRDAARVRALLAEHELALATEPSLRFVINWETDANDVDFHIYDAQGGHAFFGAKSLGSGGRLYADVTTGYGPECFTIDGTASAGPYELQAHYYSMGPMGYGMGKLEVLGHDGRGGLRFDERPFVIMTNRAFVDLGKVEGS